MTPLADLLEIGGAGGAVLGGTVGYLVPQRGFRPVAENIALGAALGGPGGVLIGFLVWLTEA